MGIQLPIKLPTTLDKYKIGIQLPIRLPFRINRVKKDDIYYQKKLKLVLFLKKVLAIKSF